MTSDEFRLLLLLHCWLGLRVIKPLTMTTVPTARSVRHKWQWSLHSFDTLSCQELVSEYDNATFAALRGNEPTAIGPKWALLWCWWAATYWFPWFFTGFAFLRHSFNVFISSYYFLVEIRKRVDICGLFVLYCLVGCRSRGSVMVDFDRSCMMVGDSSHSSSTHESRSSFAQWNRWHDTSPLFVIACVIALSNIDT